MLLQPFHGLTKLSEVYRILWDIIEQLYGQNISCEGRLSTNDTVTRLFNLEQKLSSWEQDLRPNLRTLSYEQLTTMRGYTELTGDQRAAQTLRIVLTLRYLNIRLLLHRPILVKFLDSRSQISTDVQDISMLRQIGSHSLQVCMHTAGEIISIVHLVVTSLDATRTSIGAWWYTLYYSKSHIYPRHGQSSYVSSLQRSIGSVWMFPHRPVRNQGPERLDQRLRRRHNSIIKQSHYRHAKYRQGQPHCG